MLEILLVDRIRILGGVKMVITGFNLTLEILLADRNARYFFKGLRSLFQSHA